jgi:hypothetical protein
LINPAYQPPKPTYTENPTDFGCWVSAKLQPSLLQINPFSLEGEGRDEGDKKTTTFLILLTPTL